jgi:hypothetical protein
MTDKIKGGIKHIAWFVELCRNSRFGTSFKKWISNP